MVKIKTTRYDIIMFRQIFVILTRIISIYALHTYSSHTALVSRDSLEDKYNTIHHSYVFDRTRTPVKKITISNRLYFV